MSWIRGCKFGGVNIVVSSISSGGVSDVKRLMSIQQRAKIIERAVGLSAVDRVIFIKEYLKVWAVDLVKKLLPSVWVSFLQKKK